MMRAAHSLQKKKIFLYNNESCLLKNICRNISSDSDKKRVRPDRDISADVFQMSDSLLYKKFFFFCRLCAALHYFLCQNFKCY